MFPEVSRALQEFISNGKKVPSSIKKASIFSKPYFVGRFLPALKVYTGPHEDVKEAFMQLLRKQGLSKI